MAAPPPPHVLCTTQAKASAEAVIKAGAEAQAKAEVKVGAVLSALSTTRFQPRAVRRRLREDFHIQHAACCP